MYPLVIYRDWGLKDYGDRGLVAHEVTHVAQWLAGVLLGLLATFILRAIGCPGGEAVAGLSIGLHAVLYVAAPEYREWAEAQAYRRQLRYYADDRRELFAKFLAQRYDLHLTEAEALEKLK